MNPSAAHAEAVTAEDVARFAVAGTAAECIAQVRTLFEAGIDELTIRPYGVDGGSRASAIEAFARQVMPAFS